MPLSRALCGQRGEYALGQRLGKGGVSEVYLAIDAAAARTVAVKVLRPELGDLPMLVDLFRDEIRIARQLRHRNVCEVIDWGEDDAGRPFMVLEHLEGATFAHLVPRLGGRFDLIARIVCDAARGRHADHDATGPDGAPLGVVHRDVSPANVFVVRSGRTVVTDFGVAVAEARTKRTPAGSWRGNPAYMSPEQLAWQPTDRRADVFALGIVLWEAAVGRPLFAADGEDATIRNVWGMAVPPPSSVEPSVPPGLERIVLEALQRDVARRTSSAAEMADALEGFLASRGVCVGEPEVAALWAGTPETRD